MKKIYFGSLYSFVLSSTCFFCFVLFLITNRIYFLVGNEPSVHNLLIIQTVIIWVIVILIIITGLFTIFMVVAPLSRMNKEIHQHQKLSAKGAEELKELANNYNRFYTKLTRERETLNYEASHDTLTGVYNRKIFDSIRGDEEMEDYALLVMDIDDFKNFNDEYGHDIGDKVLQKMGGLLLKEFRSSDFCCRIGGDEFAVVMVKTDRSLEELIVRKVANLNTKMQDVSDGLPSASVSCGVAFSSDSTDPYIDADEALYQSKALGYGHITFSARKENS